MKAHYPCDLHVHSHYSPDADQIPERIFARAKKLGLKALIITDHNTTAHFDVCRQAAAKYGIETLGGIEISTRWNNQSVHILGYATQFDRDILEAGLAPTIEALNTRAQTMIEKLRQQGIADLDFATIASHQQGAYIGRHEIARAIAAAKQIDYFEAFKFIDWQQGPAFVPYSEGTIRPEEAITLVQRAGGLAVLAHSGDLMIKKGVADGARLMRELIATLVAAGLAGLERNHIDHAQNPEALSLIDELADAYQLLSAGGSDWHNTLFTGHYDLGAWGCDEKTFSEIKKRAVEALG